MNQPDKELTPMSAEATKDFSVELQDSTKAVRKG